MTKLKCIIIDDDPLITDLVMHFSEKSDMIDFCVSCNDPVEGLKLLSNSSFDILFLDYNMPLLNGRDLLDIKKDDSMVIMITSNSEFAVDSYEYESVIDYLTKPIDYNRFLKAVSKVYTSSKNDEASALKTDVKSILVKDGNNWFPVKLESILFIKSESNYCIFQTTEGKIMSLAKLKEMVEKLPPNFIRCHRSYIINTKNISRINLEVVHINDVVIPISDKYKEEVKRFLEKGN